MSNSYFNLYSGNLYIFSLRAQLITLLVYYFCPNVFLFRKKIPLLTFIVYSLLLLQNTPNFWFLKNEICYYFKAGEVDAGNIVVIAGLKLAQTGDTLVLNKSVLAALEDNVNEDERLSLVGPIVPDPVVFCSVESPSLAQQKQFDLGKWKCFFLYQGVIFNVYSAGEFPWYATH